MNEKNLLQGNANPSENQEHVNASAVSKGVACTNCGGPMLGRSCKLRCPKCGFFEDCSDVGLPAYGD